MSSQPQLQHYFSHLNMSGLQNQAELLLVADDASIPTAAQMRRALRGRRGSTSLNSLDRRSYHTPSCLKDSGKKGLMRWDASPSSSSLALSTLSRNNKSNSLKASPSADSLLVLPQRRWKDIPSTSRSEARSKSEGFRDSSKLRRMQNAHQHNIVFEGSTKNWHSSSSCAAESSNSSSHHPSLNKAPAASSTNLCQEGYLASVLSSLAAENTAAVMDGHNHTTNHSPTPPTVLIARALDISLTSPRRKTDVTPVTRAR